MKKTFLFIIMVTFINLYAQEGNSNSSNKNDLLKANLIGVTIGGTFIANGTYSALMTERADQFITRIFTEAKSQVLAGAKDEKMMVKIKNEFDNYAKRDIVLKRFSGEVIKLDLEKFRLTGDFKFNPYLKNDDVIIFPAYDFNTSFVEINGAVNKKIKFQFVEGDNLSDAILFAGGVNPVYDNVKQAEISRLDLSGNNEELIKINFKDDFLLKSGDRIRILADESHKFNYKVLVLGEVKFPGYIYITKDSTTLKEVIIKAGGLNSIADMDRAELVRDNNATELLRKNWIANEFSDKISSTDIIQNAQSKWKFMEDSLSILRLNTLTDEDIYYFFNIDNALRVLHHDQIVDFTKVFIENSDESKFLVNDGDVILIPKKFDYVYVFGQIPKTGYIKYNYGKDYRYYIEKAGGKTQTAFENDDDIAIIKAKDKNWIKENKEKIKIEPGDYIYVPKDVPHTFNYYLMRIGSVTSIIGAVATIILLLVQFGK